MSSVVKFETLSKCKVDEDWGQIYVTREGNYEGGKIVLTIKGPGSQICINVGLEGLYKIDNCIKEAINVINYNTNEEKTLKFIKSITKDATDMAHMNEKKTLKIIESITKFEDHELSSFQDLSQQKGDLPADVEPRQED